jgi:hypothetical protein
MVWKRRSTAAGLQHAELVGVDWELPSSIDLTRRSRKSMAELRRYSGGLEVVSSDGEGFGRS